MYEGFTKGRKDELGELEELEELGELEELEKILKNTILCKLIKVN